MNLRTLLLALVLIDFAALTGYAVIHVGYLGIWQAGMADWGAVQVLADLAIALGLVCIWMVFDARERGFNPWPYLAITLVAGSFGPLLYLLRRESVSRRVAADPA